MLYRIVEHYDTENDYILDPSSEMMSEGECFICLDFLLNNEKPIFLKNQSIYCRTCHCNGLIHNECLKKWYHRNESCPICREEMIKHKTMTDIFVHQNPLIIFIYSTRFDDMIIITKKLITASLLFCAINIILVIVNYHMIYDKYDEKYNNTNYSSSA